MIKFRSYIEEKVMRAQQGFQYEKNAAAVLKPLGIVPAGFIPAGAGSDQPDLIIQKGLTKAGCELKISAASAGSLVMKYDSGKWSIGKEGEKDEEKLFIKDLAAEVGILDLISKAWSEEPYKGTGQSERIKTEISGLDNRAKYKRDKEIFKDIKGEISASKIEDYYNKKKTYYVNIGTDGFFLLGAKNPLRLEGIPRFGSSAKAKYRARVQYKGSGNYQFTFEMQFSIPAGKKSPYNIAPVVAKNNVDIKEPVNLDWFTK